MPSPGPHPKTTAAHGSSSNSSRIPNQKNHRPRAAQDQISRSQARNIQWPKIIVPSSHSPEGRLCKHVQPESAQTSKGPVGLNLLESALCGQDEEKPINPREACSGRRENESRDELPARNKRGLSGREEPHLQPEGPAEGGNLQNQLSPDSLHLQRSLPPQVSALLVPHGAPE